MAVNRIGSTAPGAEVLRRFRDEQQILARLDHSNIARLIDAGLDAGGVPYLVMDHVEDVPLTSFCREREITVARRLALFVKVCAAVQHAHQNLVIHRDIKPGNILVTARLAPGRATRAAAARVSYTSLATPGYPSPHASSP